MSRDFRTFYLSTSFLIVFDDVWSHSDWDRLSVVIPQKNNKGEVLITNRMEDVGVFASCPRQPNKLRFFTEAGNWELLRREALRKMDCPPELEIVGQLIARYCEGLPLEIVVIGGILAAKFSAKDSTEVRKAWEKGSIRVNTYLSENDPANRMKKFIPLSYDRLPYHLRACFLYLGVFPEDCVITVSRLVCMWIGEGLIQKNDNYSLEEVGEMYLEDL